MKIDAKALANLLLISGIFIFAAIQEVNSKGGGRGGGGGSRGGGSRYSGGGWVSHYSSGGYRLQVVVLGRVSLQNHRVIGRKQRRLELVHMLVTRYLVGYVSNPYDISERQYDISYGNCT